MRSSKYSEEQIAFALKQVELGVSVAECCRKMGISEQTYYRWKKRYAGMGVAEVRRLKQLEEENRKLMCWARGPAWQAESKLGARHRA